MRKLETNDWILLNSIIYKIHTMENMTQMRTQLLEQIRMLVDFDSADFYLASADGDKHLVRPVTYNCDVEDVFEYGEPDYSRGILYAGKSPWQHNKIQRGCDRELLETDSYVCRNRIYVSIYFYGSI